MSIGLFLDVDRTLSTRSTVTLTLTVLGPKRSKIQTRVPVKLKVSVAPGVFAIHKRSR